PRRILFDSSTTRHTRSKRDWSSDVCSSDLKSSQQTRYQHLRQTGPPSGIQRQQESPGCVAVLTEPIVCPSVRYSPSKDYGCCKMVSTWPSGLFMKNRRTP